MIQEKDGLEIINEELIPALNTVGEGFEKGTVFLPQLLMSAEAAKTAFAVLKEKMDSSGEVQEKKGKIILATVKGDIHDIGKNIVKVLLENYSFDVIDLGKPKDSPVRLFVGRQPWFTGQMGCYKKNVAVKIEKCIASQIEEKKTDIMPQKEEDPDNSDGSVKEQG